MPSFQNTSLLLVGLWLSQASASALAVTPFRDSFIVEAHPSHGPLGEEFLDKVAGRVSSLGGSCKATARRHFNSVYFTGASFDLECDAGVDQAAVLPAIQSLGAVGKSWPLGSVQPLASIPKGTGPTAPIERGVGVVNDRRAVFGAVVPGGADAFGPLSTHTMGNVDRMHAANFTGAGVRIAVIDSGFDTTVHAFGETKIEYTKDSTNNSTIVSDDCTMHGTHVLGIIGAKSVDNLYGVSGVARDATFELYKIQGCGDKGATLDTLLAAFIEAAERGVDVITCSYGGTGAFPEEPWSLTAGRIAADGIFVSLPSGNDGPGPLTGGAPGTAQHITAVGSADNTLYPCTQWRGSLKMGSNAEDIALTPGMNMSFPTTELAVWSPAKMDTDEKPSNCSFVQTDPPQDPDNTIVLIKTTQCWVDSAGVPLLSSSQYNLTYALYYNPKAPEGQPEVCPPFRSMDDAVSGIVATSHATGLAVQAELAKGGQVKVTVPNSLANSRLTLSNPKNPAGGLASSYSSWGPSLDGRTMPALVAPGRAILSAFPARIGSWGVISGTSMSTPYIGGVAALLKQYNRNLTAAQIQAKMASTARPINYNNRVGTTAYIGETQNFLAPILHQGGGLVDAWAAAHTRTLVNVSSLSFNDTAHRPARLSFEIANTGKEELIYHLSSIGAASGLFMNTTGGAKYNLTGNMGTAVFARLQIEPQTVRIGPGKTASVAVSVAAEPDLEGGVSYFGGYVALNASTSTAYAESVTIPYTGFKGDLASLPMINEDLTFGASLDLTSRDLVRVESRRLFTCEYNRTAETRCSFVPDGLAPAVSISLVSQTRNMTVDLINHGTGAVVLPDYFDNNATNAWDNGDGTYWNTTDTFLPPGDYAWRVTALRLNADSGTDKDWDVWESFPWTLNYTANSTGIPPHKRDDRLPSLAMRRRVDGRSVHLF